MTTEASTLLAAALKTATVNGSFSPAELGERVGLSKAQAEAAARWLANAGVLELGFDSAASFSPAYRKANPVAASVKKVRKIRPKISGKA